MMDKKRIKEALHAHKSAERALHNQRYFKTGPGEYGEGDIFIGVRMGPLRSVAQRFREASFTVIKSLLYSPIHEERQLALLILVYKYPDADEKERQAIFDFYLDHLNQVNNWDLVDTSSHCIIGRHLHGKETNLLHDLARHPNLWYRRVAIVATFYSIKEGNHSLTIEIATILRKDSEDLIHKAVGWMLREVGKRDKAVAKGFLNRYAYMLPRTMLRYALERFPKEERDYYMQQFRKKRK